MPVNITTGTFATGLAAGASAAQGAVRNQLLGRQQALEESFAPQQRVQLGLQIEGLRAGIDKQKQFNEIMESARPLIDASIAAEIARLNGADPETARGMGASSPEAFRMADAFLALANQQFPGLSDSPNARALAVSLTQKGLDKDFSGTEIFQGLSQLLGQEAARRETQGFVGPTIDQLGTDRAAEVRSLLESSTAPEEVASELGATGSPRRNVRTAFGEGLGGFLESLGKQESRLDISPRGRRIRR